MKAKILDLESRGQEDDHQSLRLWLRLLTCTNLIDSSIRDYLRREYQCTLPRFDLMAQLDANPRGLTMGELAKMMMVSGGNVTGIVHQLEKDGLVLREPQQKDQRSYVVKLSKTGKKYFSDMAPAHEAWVAEIFEDMAPEEMQLLMKTLAKLKSHTRSMQSQQRERLSKA